MKNLVGPDSFALWPQLAAMPGVALHLYGKSEARPGRKLGHATRLLPRGTLREAPDAAALAPL
jgi:5-(carboxyamino)imidazole ribonucleotide synthase